MKFKVGDEVKIISKKNGDEYTTHGFEINNICKITKIDKDRLTIFNGHHEGYIFKYNVELVREFTKSDLKHGDKCTLKNGQVVFVDKSSTYGFDSIDEQLRFFNDNVSIVKVERPIKYETVFERKEEILDKTEKRYLANIIRPFRDRVKWIRKGKLSDNEYISIEVKNERICLLYFSKGTMYKEMEEDKEYTLKELGL